MIRVALAILILGLLAGAAIGLAHTDAPTTVTPPLAPAVPQYGDREAP